MIPSVGDWGPPARATPQPRSGLRRRLVRSAGPTTTVCGSAFMRRLALRCERLVRGPPVHRRAGSSGRRHDRRRRVAARRVVGDDDLAGHRHDVERQAEHELRGRRRARRARGRDRARRRGRRCSSSTRRSCPRASRCPAASPSAPSRTTTSAGRKPSTNVPGESRRRSPFVQPPTACRSAKASPAPATIPIDAQKRPVVCWPTCVATQSNRPAVPAASAVVSPRVVSYSPYLRIRSPLSAVSV